jgi:hypothetical protein
MGVLPQALEIIFEVKMKRSIEKITRKKKLSNSQNVFFFFFWTPPIFKATFSFLVHFNQFKML